MKLFKIAMTKKIEGQEVERFGYNPQWARTINKAADMLYAAKDGKGNPELYVVSPKRNYEMHYPFCTVNVSDKIFMQSHFKIVDLANDAISADVIRQLELMAE